MREIVLPEEFSQLYHAARETINNYERSKSHAAEWASDSTRISKVLGDRIRLTHTNRDFLGTVQATGPSRAAVDAALTAFRTSHTWTINDYQ